MVAKKELFIVEGKSAASTLEQAINKSDQCILAIQGKLINVAKATPTKVYANIECAKIFQSLACGVGEGCQPEKLSYSRILILTDPDIDGAHTRALVLTLFDRYLRSLVDSGLVSVVIPPVFRIANQQIGEDRYAWSEQERDQVKEKMDGEIAVTRFKGVAQFSLVECVQLFLDSKTRKQVDLC
jgi:DNA gyrase subunit B